MSSRTLKLNGKNVVTIAVPCIEEARMALLASGLYEVCPGSDNSLIDKETGVQVRLVPISGGN